MRHLTAGVLLATLVSCSNDPLASVEGGLRIYPSTPVARPGDPLTVHLLNWSGQVLQENLCQMALQQRQGVQWVSVYTEPGDGGVCPAYLNLFRSGQVLARPVSLPADLAEGRYRIVFEGISLDDRHLPEELRASTAFEVRESLPL